MVRVEGVEPTESKTRRLQRPPLPHTVYTLIWQEIKDSNLFQQIWSLLCYQLHQSPMVVCMGFEPMNHAVKGRCVKPLHQQTIIFKWRRLRDLNPRMAFTIYGFQDRPFQPNSSKSPLMAVCIAIEANRRKPTHYLAGKSQAFWVYRPWCQLQESNSQPTNYKSVALPIELSWHIIIWLGCLDSNQSNHRVKVCCLTNLATSQYFYWQERKELNLHL